MYQALKLGVHDYVVKCGFQKVIVGLSGGIDSSLVATLAADALGPQNVTGVGMPGPIPLREASGTPKRWPAICASTSGLFPSPLSSKVISPRSTRPLKANHAT